MAESYSYSESEEFTGFTQANLGDELYQQKGNKL